VLGQPPIEIFFGVTGVLLFRPISSPQNRTSMPLLLTEQHSNGASTKEGLGEDLK
jgi:hypothetical protein